FCTLASVLSLYRWCKFICLYSATLHTSTLSLHDALPIFAFERLEALRYAHFLKKDGALIVNDWRIDPMPVVIGNAEYPENILEKLAESHKVYRVDATEESKKLGNPKVFNLIVLGVAAQHMDFTKEQWYDVIEKTVPPKTIEINKKAFDVGYSLKECLNREQERR